MKTQLLPRRSFYLDAALFEMLGGNFLEAHLEGRSDHVQQGPRACAWDRDSTYFLTNLHVLSSRSNAFFTPVVVFVSLPHC